jgi:hypothetical protein
MTSVEPVERAIERGRGGMADAPDDIVQTLPSRPRRSRDFTEDAAWRADPTGRHELRFWDGSEWTAYISGAGTTGSDTVLIPSTVGWYPDMGLRNEKRYWDGRFWTDHVQNGGAPSNDPMTEAPR